MGRARRWEGGHGGEREGGYCRRGESYRWKGVLQVGGRVCWAREDVQVGRFEMCQEERTDQWAGREGREKRLERQVEALDESLAGSVETCRP